MSAGTTGNDDVYSTSDATWTVDADDDGTTAAQGTGSDDHDDTGDTGAHDAAAGDDMTDDRTGSATTAAADSPPAGSPSGATNQARSGKKRDKRAGRATRPQGAAANPGEPDGQEARSGSGTSAPAGETGTKRPTGRPAVTQQPVVLRAHGLVKRYGQTLAVDDVDLEIRKGSIFGVVGPNGAGKTTTLSVLTGLLRPDAGTVTVLDHDVWSDPTAAKRAMGVLPDRLRLFDRLTGAQMLFYSATLHGLDGKTARSRSADLAEAFGLGDALGRPVADYSMGMSKKIALAATLIHSPRVLVLDEPFESVDPVSATTITDILRRYTAGGGTVVLSSHSMELVQRTCDSVAIIVGGKVLAAGTMAQVRGRRSLEDKFVELAGGRPVAESMEWLHSFSG
ncbi:ABC transporter ATP-binding protein [Curtobacterium herbarum]|uniref:ABC transporter domain-containing protein n=1 Tax=Curtobacterium herbarum TaxID=150122 RepID=A0ABP4K358_9MICO|nr:ATP-binding cassette domain-containing protein [Curtobacterium herbarum]MBM7476172.1 ABC-2 type transport system ATP-binding protein [Curtobacterium herbarum]MCS6544260.1 ATP-binding cassette domain-containing protein [Curtobacterium herbarum]